jgi:PAS domain S-box-containing protein
VERARAEEALRRSETQFRSLVEATSDTVYKMSADGQQISQIFDRDFLADKPSARGTWLEQYIPVADQPQVQAATEAVVRAKAMFELEHRVIQADGSAGWAYSRAIPLLDAQGAITEWLGTAQNVTARKQAEAQLRDFTAHLEQLVAERTQAFLHAQEAERSRIAESLHNGLGQLLYAIKLQVSQLDVPALHTLPALNEVRKYTNQLLAEAIQQTRTLSHELMPVALSEQGLGPALRAICRGLSTPQLRLTCQVWLDEQVLSPPLQTALYRLAQELAHNIAKHSGASQGKLEFEMLPGWINLRAEDNGHGFDTTTTAWGLGLRLLHEAVGLLGGTILVESSGEYGTYIRLHIPIT